MVHSLQLQSVTEGGGVTTHQCKTVATETLAIITTYNCLYVFTKIKDTAQKNV